MGGEDDVRIPDLVKSFLAAAVVIVSLYFYGLYIILAIAGAAIFGFVWFACHDVMYGDGK